MRYDLSKFPIGDDDTQLKDETGKPVTYREVFMKAASNDMDENGAPVRGEIKFKHYDLYTKIKKAIAIVDLTIDEVAMLKQRSLAFPTIVAGQARDLLAKPDQDLVIEK